MTYETGVDKLQNISKVIKKNSIETIFEVGARDCLESLALSKKFPNADVFAFECNPSTLPICRKNIELSNNKKIHLTEKAVCDTYGEISFFQIDQNKTKTSISDGNPGASSMFEASGSYPIETYVQNKITVNSTTLFDEITQKNIKNIDILWMDVQGAEILVFKGAKEKIDIIKIIHTEVNFFEIYKGQPMFLDVYNYLSKKNFVLYTFTTFGKYAGDAVFINKNYIKKYLYPYIYVKSLFLYKYKRSFQIIKEIIKKIFKKIMWYKRLLIEKVWFYYAKNKNKNKKVIEIKEEK